MVDQRQDVLEAVLGGLEPQLSGLVLLDEVVLDPRTLGLTNRDCHRASLTRLTDDERLKKMIICLFE